MGRDGSGRGRSGSECKGPERKGFCTNADYLKSLAMDWKGLDRTGEELTGCERIGVDRIREARTGVERSGLDWIGFQHYFEQEYRT
jgi:hypothetical protein